MVISLRNSENIDHSGESNAEINRITLLKPDLFDSWQMAAS